MFWAGRNLIVTGFLLALFLEMTFAFPLHAAESAAAREAFEQGLALKSEARLNEAEISFKKALEEEPSNADYHFELANVFAMQFDAALASRDYLKADESLASAARELEQALMIRPDFMAARFNLGVVYKKQRKYEDARREFKKGMDLIPPDQPVTPFLMQIGSIYEDQGFYDDAESVYQEAREKDYGSTEVRNALETLNERREWSAERARREQAVQSQNRWRELGSLSRGMQPGLNATDAEQQPGFGQMIPALGTWLVQQMMSRRGNSSDSQQ